MAAERDATSGEQQGSGYLVGSDVRALFAGALNFREQCDAAGLLFKDLDSGCDDDVGMMVEEEAEEAGRDVCAHARTTTGARCATRAVTACCRVTIATSSTTPGASTRRSPSPTMRMSISRVLPVSQAGGPGMRTRA